jgi:hypothetical protein
MENIVGSTTPALRTALRTAKDRDLLRAGVVVLADVLVSSRTYRHPFLTLHHILDTPLLPYAPFYLYFIILRDSLCPSPSYSTYPRSQPTFQNQPQDVGAVTSGRVHG